MKVTDSSEPLEIQNNVAIEQKLKLKSEKRVMGKAAQTGSGLSLLLPLRKNFSGFFSYIKVGGLLCGSRIALVIVL